MRLIETQDDVEDLVNALRDRRAEIRAAHEAMKQYETLRTELLLRRDQQAHVEATIARIREELKASDEATTMVLRARL